jgi:hypothetical protein
MSWLSLLSICGVHCCSFRVGIAEHRGLMMGRTDGCGLEKRGIEFDEGSSCLARLLVFTFFVVYVFDIGLANNRWLLRREMVCI